MMFQRDLTGDDVGRTKVLPCLAIFFSVLVIKRVCDALGFEALKALISHEHGTDKNLKGKSAGNLILSTSKVAFGK